MGTADNLFTLAIDQVEMLTAATDGDVIAAHTRNRPIVTMAESLVRHDYYMAEIFNRFGKEIDVAFGPHLRDLRIGCFTPEQIASFKERRSEEHTSELQSLMRISYAVFCLKKKKIHKLQQTNISSDTYIQ